LRLSAPARFPYCFKPCILPQSEAFVQCTKKNLMLRGALKNPDSTPRSLHQITWARPARKPHPEQRWEPRLPAPMPST